MSVMYIKQSVRNCINVYKVVPKSYTCQDCQTKNCSDCTIKQYLPKLKIRSCLCCDKAFASLGSYNRRCYDCEQSLESCNETTSGSFVNAVRM